jgi:photosystem II stability/assembly factor-like uncharacterized protein
MTPPRSACGASPSRGRHQRPGKARSAVAWLGSRLASALVIAASVIAPLPSHASPIADALERPAVVVRSPERAVLLGAARAGSRIVAVGERGIVIVSDDEAQHWKQASAPVSVTLTAVKFADKDHGYAIGHGGTVLGTADGGHSWKRVLDGRRIAQVMQAAAKASGDAAALKSADRLLADGPDKPLLDMLVFDAKRVLVVGAYGIALLTEDGGTSWNSWRARLDNPKELHLYAVRQRGTRVVIAGEQGLVLQSLDGGATFRRLAVPYAGSFFTAELPDDRTIVVAGLRGNVWRSADAGASWVPVASPVPVSITASALREDGELLLANQAGMILGAQGDALKPLNAAPLPPVNFVLPLDRARVLALTVQGLQLVDFRSADDTRKGPSQ